MNDVLATEGARPQPVRLFLYSLFFPFSWASVAALVNVTMPGKHLGALGLLIVLYLTVSLIGWRFAKTYRRQAAGSERMWLIAFCVLWAVGIELLVIFALATEPGGPSLAPDKIAGIFALTIAFDVLFIALAFTFLIRRSINFFLVAPPAAAPQGTAESRRSP